MSEAFTTAFANALSALDKLDPGPRREAVREAVDAIAELAAQRGYLLGEVERLRGERDKAEKERDEARAEVERLREELYKYEPDDLPHHLSLKGAWVEMRKDRERLKEVEAERDVLRRQVEQCEKYHTIQALAQSRREGAREALNRMRALLGDQALENTSAGKIPFAFYATAQDAAVRDIDRILADYAEPDEQPGPEVWGSLKDLEDGREDAEPNLEVDGCGVPFYSRAEREDAEGDDVLREWVAMVDDADYPIDLRAKVIAELCRAELRRRALGGAK